ncbi:MAG: DUF2335 domain-containing protein [Muribaculaceae bacterium]|nr:DUF2335 domain-containing protein [Muribaculaceae bacterium]
MTKQLKVKDKRAKKVQHLETERVLNPEVINPEVINPGLNEILNGLAPKQRGMVIQAIKQESFKGPIPHPELLQKYENIQPGFAERMVSMAEQQLDHRIKCEDKIVDGSIAESKRGQTFGLIVSLFFLGAAVLLGMYNHEWLAGGLGGGTLLGLVTVFVTNKPNKSDDNTPQNGLQKINNAD